jgi:exonuclease SbcD
MRLCHLSDSHLGAGENHPRRGASGLTLRQEDIINSFRLAVNGIIELRPDVCIHSGDLFDKVRPLNSIMAVAGRELFRLAEEAGIPTVLITGNHDAPKQPHVGAAIDVFRQIDNLYVASAGELEIFEIANAKFFALPHCLSASQLKEQVSRCQPDPQARYNILILHGVAAGMPEFSMADLGEQELPLEMMERFDYTALGHYHNFSKVADRAYYAGSTERLSQAERGVTKGFLEISLSPFNVTLHEVPCREVVDIKSFSAAGLRGDQLIVRIRDELDRIQATDKIVRVNVSDMTPETMKTLPGALIGELKESAFDLNLRFEKAPDQGSDRQFGRAAVGRLDSSFAEYLESVELKGLDRARLLEAALRYLRAED